eukprot:sb/3478734/
MGIYGGAGERERETERQRDRETERQRDRETERQRDRVIKLDEKRAEKLSLPTVIKKSVNHPNPLFATHLIPDVPLKSHTAYVMNGYTNYNHSIPPRLIP